MSVSDRPTAEQLIAERNAIDDKIKAATKLLAAHLAPAKERIEQIDAELMTFLNSLGDDKASISTDAGIAYKSHLLNVSIDPEGEAYVNAAGEEQKGRMALLDWALENWNEGGSDLLLVQPQKDSVKAYMEAHDGKPPPGLRVNWFTRVNVRRS
jgi:hypothetical protein